MLVLDYAKIKDYYDRELWTKEMVGNAVKKNKITEDEFRQITGEDYIA